MQGYGAGMAALGSILGGAAQGGFSQGGAFT